MAQSMRHASSLIGALSHEMNFARELEKLLLRTLDFFDVLAGSWRKQKTSFPFFLKLSSS